MSTVFHKKDIESWNRRDEFNSFSSAGCGFTMTADADISALYAFAHERGIKLYPLLVSVMIQVINRHEEFRYGRHDGEFGCYDEVCPLFFDLTPEKNVKSLYAPYKNDVLSQVDEIERVRLLYKDSHEYRPQTDMPENVVNISCVPWVKFSGLSFCLQYCATYYPPIITFGKYEKKDGKIIIPLSVYCNHAVNDGYHCARLFNEFQQLADSLV